MLSERKLQANRLNAQKSTGPRTDAGKERVSFNAVKHGLFAGHDVLLPSESDAELQELRQAVIDATDPRDAIELAMVERMVAARWKLRRIAGAERRVYE